MSVYPKCEELVVAYGGGRIPDNRLACSASVSVRFRNKERRMRVKDRAKNGASKKAGSSGKER